MQLPIVVVIIIVIGFGDRGPIDKAASLNGSIEGAASYAAVACVECDAGVVGCVVEVRFGEGLGEGGHGCFYLLSLKWRRR